MPRPKRTRRTRPMAREATAPTQTASDVIPSTPLKPTEATQPSSSEKENRPDVASRSRAVSTGSTRRGRALRDSTVRRSSSVRRPEGDNDVAVEDNSLELSDPDLEISRRDTATPQRRRDMSGLDIDDEVFSDMYSGLEPPSTRGRSANTSTLSVGQFKRRSRAPSIISRDGGPIRPSSRGLNTPSVSSTFNFGQFRRRAREPSILGTNRRPRNENQTTDQSASESELDGEDFAPDAVSTPLDRDRAQRATSATRHSQPPSSALRSRKRKSGEVGHAESDRPEKTTRVERDDESEREEVPEQDVRGSAAVSDAEDDLSSLSDVSLPSPASVIVVTGERPVTPVNATMEEIMAPPASSGSESGVDWPSIRKLANRRRRAATPITPLHARDEGDILSDVSSPPSLTHSPNFSSRKRGAKTRGRKPTREPSPEPLTSALASLLPQRRSKNAGGVDEFDSEEEVEYSALGQDEDELAYSRSTRRRVASRSRSRPASARPPSRQAARSQAIREQAAIEASRRVTQTYGSRNKDADDSFAPLPEDSFTTDGIIIDDPKQELKKATRKFKEVDKWELAYEEVTESPDPSDADAR
ncbi:hypothetical protein jhhlp_000892 [Lomentospora prolificans]|uniref:Uncharacterized protein n=1 Tax=Lomentospora prolificans TaxID=41688 RepID=A0A2N3NJT6_9PEZI|nr:hypothetical protein jhhlp_000892 [Lomentospora prolificans]